MRLCVVFSVLAMAGIMMLSGCPGGAPEDHAAGIAADAPVAEPAEPGSGATAPPSGRVVTAVPCGVAGPYGDICDLMKESDPGIDMQPDIANTMVLNRKLADGKGACDAYLAMGNVEVEAIREVGKVARAVPIAGMGLGLIVAKGNPLGIQSISDLANDNVKAITIARPNSSVGFAAEQALRNAGVWAAVERKTARPDAPSDLKTFVIRGQADAAIIYETCLVEVHKPGQEKQEAGQGVSTKLQDVGRIDQELYDPFFLHVVVPTDAQNPAGADAFIRACLSDAGQAALENWLFIPLDPADRGTGG